MRLVGGGEDVVLLRDRDVVLLRLVVEVWGGSRGRFEWSVCWSEL